MAVDINTVRTWYDIFHPEGSTMEVRVLDGKRTLSGYYRDRETAVAAIASVTSGGIYSPINEVKASCYSRSQCNALLMAPKATTNDNDIDGRNWILVDLDPRRSSDTNSTDAEKAAARNVMMKVGEFLRNNGMEKPVVADSGNGWHLYYRVSLANNDDNTALVKDFLSVLDMLFSDATTDIDTAVYNAARISKVIGTRSNKGSDTPERPQRMSSFVRIPSEIVATDKEVISRIASMLPKTDIGQSGMRRGERFDLEAFIAQHGIPVARRTSFKGGTKYVLEQCPFDQGHKAPDSAIFQMSDGSLGFKCLHNSCSHRTWRDLRMMFDPHAYDRDSYREFVSRMQSEVPKLRMPRPECDELGKKWLSMGDIQWVDMSQIVTMPTGYSELDRKIKGLMVGDVTVLSGLSGAGKTSWLDCVLLNVIDKGFRTSVWSGELQPFRFQSWIDQIAAGSNMVVRHEGYDNMYYAPRHICDKIHEWLGDRLTLYNNEYGAKWSQLLSDISYAVDGGSQLIVLDNLAALDLDSNDRNKYDLQTRFITDIKELAKRRNVHVIIVAHPRKELTFLRKESISGTADLTNLADNVLIIHRVGKDFESRAGVFLGNDKVKDMLRYDCVIEVAKNRSFGVVDHYCGMYYDAKSRRLMNEPDEIKVYGWVETPVQTELEIELKRTRWDWFPEPLNIPDTKLPF